MITKAQVKLIQALRLPKNRATEGLFVVEGVKMVNELLASDHEVVRIFATSEWPDQALTAKRHRQTGLHELSQVPYVEPEVEGIKEWELEKISSLSTPNQVLALVKIPGEKPMGDLGRQLVLLLDKVSDPGNMGTIIRTAEWFGMNRVIASSDSVDFYNPKVVQASMGSVFRMPIHTVDIMDFLAKATGQVYGTLFDGEPLGCDVLTRYGIIIAGNESNGISPQVQQYVTCKLTIPAATTAASESLNVSMATAIVCYEFRRQFPV